MATQEAVQRRRDNRAATTAFRERQQREREQREREIAVRVSRRFWGDGPVYAVVLNYTYWQARRCGWDALSREIRGRDAQGQVYPPSESPFWRWWSAMHPKVRNQLVKMSGNRIHRA